MQPEVENTLDLQVDAAIAEYLAAAKSGALPHRDEFLAQHKAVAAELAQFLDDHAALDEAVQLVGGGSTRGAANSTGRDGKIERETLTSPRCFGDFELIEELARGGMGVVYKARQTTPGRIVALKMILAGQFASRADVDRFYAEAHAAAALDHPNIVPIFEVGEHDGQHYFTMAFIEGQSLGQRLADGPLPAVEAAKNIRDVTLAVEYAHRHGVIHRDLKPSNILLGRDGRVRVTDFGLAKRQSDDGGLTRTGELLGTPSFMSPEQVSGDPARIGPGSDIYSLGATLYALLTGRPPFQAANTVDTLRQVLDKEPVPPRELDASIPRDLETVVVKCLEKPADRRYGSAQSLADELSRYLEGRPIQARPVSRREHVWRWCRRNPVVAGSAAAVVFALTAGVIASSYFAASASREAKSAVAALNHADSQRRVAEGVNTFFSKDVFGLANPMQFKRAGISLREAVDIAASKVDGRFPDDPQLRAVLYDRLGDIYQGSSQNEKAAVQYHNAAATWEGLFGLLDPRTLRSRSRLGRVTWDKEEGTKGLKQVLANQTKQLGANHADTLETATTLSFSLMSSRDPEDLAFVEDVYTRSLAALGPQHPTTLKVQYAYSWILRWRAAYDDALKHAERSAVGLREVLGDDDVDTMLAVYNYAACLQALGQLDPAAAELKRLYETRARVLGPGHGDTLWTMRRLVSVLCQLKRNSEARAFLKTVAPQIDDGKNTDFYLLASAFALTGDHRAAVKWAQKTADLDPDNPRKAYVAVGARIWGGDTQSYSDACRHMVDKFSDGDEEARFWVAWTCGLGPSPNAELRRPLEVARTLVAQGGEKADYRAALGMLLYRDRAFKEAAKHLAEAIAKYKDGHPEEGSVAHAQFGLAMAQWELGERDKARQTLSRALEIRDYLVRSMASWNRRETVDLFCREAQSLIAGDSHKAE